MIEWIADHLIEIIIGVVVFIFLSFFVLAMKIDATYKEELQSFKASCIDAGGYPVDPFDYVKGHGKGYLCVKEDGIIELKGEKK